MTNDEAKKMLKAKLECLKHETSGTDYACNQHLCEGCSLNYEQGNMGEQKEALDIAIKALEQQNCEDCISRKETIEWLKKVTVTDGIAFKTGFKQILYDIEQMPSVIPQPKVGKWIDVDSLDGALWHECSECGETEFYATDYCPNCGAKMEVEE